MKSGGAQTPGAEGGGVGENTAHIQPPPPTPLLCLLPPQVLGVDPQEVLRKRPEQGTWGWGEKKGQCSLCPAPPTPDFRPRLLCRFPPW